MDIILHESYWHIFVDYWNKTSRTQREGGVGLVIGCEASYSTTTGTGGTWQQPTVQQQPLQPFWNSTLYVHCRLLERWQISQTHYIGLTFESPAVRSVRAGVKFYLSRSHWFQVLRDLPQSLFRQPPLTRLIHAWNDITNFKFSAISRAVITLLPVIFSLCCCQ